jgi:hypothetical protein
MRLHPDVAAMNFSRRLPIPALYAGPSISTVKAAG